MTARAEATARWRSPTVWAVIAVGVAVYAIPALRHLGGADREVYWIALLGGPAVLAAGWLLLRRIPVGPAILAIVIGAALFRAVLVPTPPDLSTDLYRYLWDGHVQATGVNPYEHPPAALELNDLRDDQVFPRINRKSARTIYPGGAQLTFRTTWAAGLRSPTALKVLIAGLDVVAVWLLVRALRAHGRDERLAVLYAWNPLPILAFAHSGHIDVLVVLAVAGAAIAWTRDRQGVVGGLLGLAGAVKLFPLLVLPAFLRRREGRFSWIVPTVAVAVTAVSYVPYASAGRRVFGYLTSGYLDEEGYVSGRRFIAARLLDVDGLVLVGVVAVTVGVAALLSRRPATTKAAWLLGAALLLTVPYPWYATSLLALAVAGGTGIGHAPDWVEGVWPAFGATLQIAYVNSSRPLTGIGSTTIRQWLISAVVAALVVAALGRLRRGPPVVAA